MTEETKNLIIKNIDFTYQTILENRGPAYVVLVSGNADDEANWQLKIQEAAEYLFNADGSCVVLSFEEKHKNKGKQGNFFGTLLAYWKMETWAQKAGKHYKDRLVLVGMLFGRGERMSPFTQVEGDRKPAIEVNSHFMAPDKSIKVLSAIEEGLFGFVPVVRYLEERGFRGFLDKWGDETEIPSIDMTLIPENTQHYAQTDLIKIISPIIVTPELAAQKDFVLFNEKDDFIGMLPRAPYDSMVQSFESLGIKADNQNRYTAGVSLGPVAMSYDLLQFSLDFFRADIETPGVILDFDPYFLMALSIDDKALWEKITKNDENLKKLDQLFNNFYQRISQFKKAFEEKFRRPLKLKVLNLGEDIYWADIGQHQAMYDKYFSLLNDDALGEISRKLENLPGKRDENGNIIISSEIETGIEVRDSVLINSRLKGKGSVSNCVVKNSTIENPEMNQAFSISSVCVQGECVLQRRSGLYKYLGKGGLVLKPYERAGTLFTNDVPLSLKVHEKTDLRDRDNHYNKPILGNSISFSEAYDKSFGISNEMIAKKRMVFLKQMEADE